MKILILFISLCCGFFTKATTYYISSTGSDVTGTGTLSNPWKTLSKATSTVTIIGDIIHIKLGTYTETIQSNLSTGVSIEGEGLSTTIIKSIQIGTWSNFLSLNSNSDGTNGNQHITGLTLDGGYVSETNLKTWVGIWVTARSNVIIHDCSLINWKQTAIIFNGIASATNPGTDVGYVKATGNKIYNCTISNSAAMYNGTGQGAIMYGFQNGMEIYNNNISQTQRVNFANGWCIKYWNQGWSDQCKIYNNTLTKIPYSGTYPGENGNWDFCIELFSNSGLQIYNNTIQGAIDLNYNFKKTFGYSVWIHNNNLVHAVLGTKVEGAIILEFRTESALIENNIINNKTYGISFNTRGVTNRGGDRLNTVGDNIPGGYSYLVDNIIRGNLFYNMYGGTGIGNRFAIGVISESTNDPQINNFRIYNNTIEAKSGDPTYIGIDLSSMSNGNGQGMYIQNNIVKGVSCCWLEGSSTHTNINNCFVQNNCTYQNGNNSPDFPAGNPIAYTYTNNLVNINPLFNTGLYTLQCSSPCIDKGINVGLPYYGTAPDIGYAESNCYIVSINYVILSGNRTNTDNLDISISTSTSLKSLELEYSMDGFSFLLKTLLPVDTRYYTLSISGNVFYRLKVTSETGQVVYSNIINLHSSSSYSITTNKGIIIINISIPFTYSIFSSQGQLLKKGNEKIINISSFSKGIYILSLLINGETHNRKILNI